MNENTETIPMDWVQGFDETTLWLWPNSPESFTVRLSLREWAQIERMARAEYDGDIEAYVSRVITADLEEHREALGTE